MSDAFSLDVNGKLHPVKAVPDTPLLYVLRDELGLSGPKFGCGLEQCGSCMVLVDGEAMPSCRRTVADLADRKIVTLEGLSAQDDGRRLQNAFLEEQAAQCGFCINGMIIAALPLLRRHPSPSAGQIKEALNRVLCRCGSYARIVQAVQRAGSAAENQQGGNP